MSELLKKQLNDGFDNKISQLKRDCYYEAKKNSLELQRKKQLDACKSIKKSKKEKHQRDSVKEVDELIKDLETSATTKTIYEFHPQHSVLIKAIGVKQSDIVKSSTRFSTGKMLMFAKLLLKSFIYDFCEAFMFPSKKTHEIYDKFAIDFVSIYQILTDTDSTSLQFIVFCKERNN